MPSLFESCVKEPPIKPNPTTSITIARNISTIVITHAKYLVLNKANPSTQIPAPTKQRNEAIDVKNILVTSVKVLISGAKALTAVLAIIFDFIPEVLLVRESCMTESDKLAAPPNITVPNATNTIPPMIMAIEIIVRTYDLCCCIFSAL